MINVSEVFVFDIPKFYKKVLDGLQDGSVIIRDGVAYLDGKIIQHLPLKSIVFDPEKLNELSGLINKAHMQQLMATGLSTSLILGAIVIQTMYLSKKLDALQKTMDEIASEIDTQNMIFYLDKISNYFGSVETARVLLAERNQNLVSETIEIANTIIPNLATARNQVMSFIDNLLGIANNRAGKQLEHMVNFINLMLDMLPKAIFIESQFCDRYQKFALSEHLMKSSSQRYINILETYRTWCNEKVSQAKNGILADRNLLSILGNNKESLKLLFNSDINKSLLNLPSKECIYVPQSEYTKDNIARILASY